MSSQNSMNENDRRTKSENASLASEMTQDGMNRKYKEMA